MATNKISSEWTFVLKVAFPAIWIPLFGIVAWLTRDESFWAAWAITALFLLVMFVPLADVEVDGRELIISRFGRKARIPMDCISDVTEARWATARPITLHFCRDTELGRSVRFLPKGDWIALWKEHPTVGLLRERSR
jgi:hypothetical protein